MRQAVGSCGTVLLVAFAGAPAVGQSPAGTPSLAGNWTGTVECPSEPGSVRFELYRAGFTDGRWRVNDVGVKIGAFERTGWSGYLVDGKVEVEPLGSNGPTFAGEVAAASAGGTLAGGEPAWNCKWTARLTAPPPVPSGGQSADQPMKQPALTEYYRQDYVAADALLKDKTLFVSGRVNGTLKSYGTLAVGFAETKDSVYGMTCYFETQDEASADGVKVDDMIVVQGKVRGGTSWVMDRCRVVAR